MKNASPTNEFRYRFALFIDVAIAAFASESLEDIFKIFGDSTGPNSEPATKT